MTVNNHEKLLLIKNNKQQYLQEIAKKSCKYIICIKNESYRASRRSI